MNEINIIGDKSISHRAAILGAMAEGKTEIVNFGFCKDTLSTLSCLKALGVKIRRKNNNVIIQSKGYLHLKEPSNILDAGNSASTMRILMGVLASGNFISILNGDKSLRSRPMKRVLLPLREMGAYISSRQDEFAPVFIKGTQLQPISYTSPIVSAQIKTAILLAGVQTDGITTYKEPILSRNHTELMLPYFGCKVFSDTDVKGFTFISVKGKDKICGQQVIIPGDFSAAAFFIALAVLIKKGNLLIKNIGLNKTRTGFLDILLKMGANIQIINKYKINGEDIGDLWVGGGNNNLSLCGIKVTSEMMPRIIDEIPILAVCATQAQGRTEIYGAEGLRTKESDRLHTICTELKKMGADIEELKDGLIINGTTSLHGNNLKTYNDHRIAMSLVIASLIAKSKNKIKNLECVKVSFPEFFNILKESFSKELRDF